MSRDNGHSEPHISNINIKHRMSRLQRTIIAVLQKFSADPDKNHYYYFYEVQAMWTTELSWLVAERYGNHSVLTWNEWQDSFYKRQSELYKELSQKDESAAKKMLNSAFDIFEKHTCYYKRQDKWLRPKFSASFSRSLKNLENKGLIKRAKQSSAYLENWCITRPRTIAVKLTELGRKI